MSGAPPPDRADGPAGGGLTPADIDRVLADFRGWLDDLLSGGGQPPEASDTRGVHTPRSKEDERVDLHTLVAQFTALRHEVNLQTKAARAAVEQTAAAIDRLKPTADPTEGVRPLVKALVDIADSLQLALTALDGARITLDGLLQIWPPQPPTIERSGFFARVFASPDDAYVRSVRGWAEEIKRWVEHNLERLRPVYAGIADGYAISLRRVEKALRDAGLEPITCEGRPFDPDTMEVVEVVFDMRERPPGTVTEVVRRGFLWNGQVYRCAQVKVAR